MIKHEDLKKSNKELHGQNPEGSDEHVNNVEADTKEDERKIKTKIPVSRFRQTAERVKKTKRRGSKDKKEPESHIPIRRSSFPKQTTSKDPAKATKPAKPARKSIHVTSIEIPKPTIPEDEFDKLYEEVLHSTPTPINIDVSLLDPKVEDPEKLESKFEEIIHDYDENKVQPIDVEKIKKSKIPFLKRRSQQEIDVSNKNSKMIAARDKLRMSHHSVRSDDSNDVNAEDTVNDVTADDQNNVEQEIEEIVELANSVTAVNEKNDDVTVKLEETSNIEAIDEISPNDNGVDESRKVFSTTIVKEIETNESKGQMREENICRDYIKIGIPVFDSYVNESTEEGKEESAVEVTVEPSNTPNNDRKSVNIETSIEVIEINNEPEVIDTTEQNVFEVVDTSETVLAEKELDMEYKTAVLKEKDVSFTDAEKLRNQDDIYTSKIDTSESVNTHKKVFGTDIPKKKSVLSKIAMFERQEVEPVVKSKIPKTDNKFSITSNTQIAKSEHIHTPLIVDEVFKPFPAKIEHNVNENNAEKIKDKHEARAVRAEMVLIKSPETVQYSIDDKVQIESNTMFIEQSLITEEVLKPVSRKYEPKSKETTKTDKENTFKEKSIITPVVVPNFIPVREVLKRYESLNASDAHVNNKTNEDIPKTKMVMVESPKIVQYGNENKVQIESNTMFIEQSLVEEEVLKPVSKKYESKSEDKTTKTDKENTFKEKSINTPVVAPNFIPVREVLKRYESLNGSDAHVNNKTIEDIPKTKMVMVESPEIVQYGNENKVQIESNTMFIEQSLVEEEVLKPVSKKYEPKSEDKTTKTHNERIFKDKNDETPLFAPKFIPVREALKRYESRNGHDTHVDKKIIGDLPKTKPISEIIKTLKPENKPRSLDIMFAHQVTPVRDILKDLKADVDQVKTEKIYATQKLNNDLNRPKIESNNIEESHRYDKTRHGFKSFRSIGSDYATLENKDDNFKTLQFIQDYNKAKNEELRRAKSVAELDLGDAVKGKVSRMIVRINSEEILDTKEVPINLKERPMKRSVLEKIALFERKSTTKKEVAPPMKLRSTEAVPKQEITAEIQAKIAELSTARLKYGKMTTMPRVQLANGVSMPVLAVGTALLDPRLAYHVVTAAIDLGYRAVDTAFIYGNEKIVGEAINAKIKDGTVTREELFITSKLWSTFHRTDLVGSACDASLQAMGLEYFDLFLIHNPMSFKEGGSPVPKIATVLQYSEFDYLDAWFGMETLGSRVRALGVSNFNSDQIKRVLDRAKVKPLVNQVECHPYLTQQNLDDYCGERIITLNCFGVLGSKGTPAEMKSGQTACIDDPLLQVMASGLSVSPAQLLIRYQLECGHTVVVKSSSAAHLWDNLQALTFNMTLGQIDALHALNRNKRNFTFKGMGDTHKNYPFKTLF